MLLERSENVLAVAPPSCASVRFSDAQLSHLRVKGSHHAAAYCHAARYRISGTIDLISLRERLEESIKTWQECCGAQCEAVPAPQLWVERVAAPANSQIAERRRNAELRRAVDASALFPCRTVLLQYADRTADLIVVAHRAKVDYQTLLWIGGSPFRETSAHLPGADKTFVDSAATPDRCADEYLARLAQSDYSLNADWGMGYRRSAVGAKCLHRLVNREEGVDSASLTAAVGLVLSRYSGQTAPVLATLAINSQEDASALGAREGLVLVPLSCSAATPAHELLSEAFQTLSNPPAWYTACLAETLSGTCEHRGAILAGIFFSEGHPEAASAPLPTEYLPCLAPPFPITITCSPLLQDTCQLTCVFQLEDFAETVMAQFFNSVMAVHRVLRAQPNTTLGAIDILDPETREQVAVLGRTKQDLTVAQERIDQAFTRTAQENPQGIALSCGEDRRTYRELEEHSSRMAAALRQCGIRDGDRIGVCLDRSVELVEVLLAILKAGAAYVPMDPAYPADRLTYTVVDAGLRLVVASRKGFHPPSAVQVVEPHELLRMTPACREQPLHHSSSSDAAYIIYTSGSTGRPKGVVVPHINVMALLASTSTDFELSPADVWTLFHSSAFDFSVWEIWGCLLTGGHLVVVPYWITRNPEEFAELLAAEKVTILNQTPSAFAQLLDVDRNRPVTSTLRLVIFGGESLDARMLLPWFDRHPEFECRVVNMFGITETTVHVTLETMTRDHALTASRSVGHAMKGWYYYVMDSERRLVPPGVAGEIYVGGAGVAQCYLNRQELTSERFLPDPYTGGRMYRSGDKGRLRPDGRLEHLGRLDTQVKIRGFRIELDEIRSVLLESPGVKTAAVIVHCDDPRDPATAKLCAYVVLQEGNISEVRRHASRVLPDYMVPSAFIDVQSLPLTPNGKLDVKRLPVPDKHACRNHDSSSVRNHAHTGNALTAALLQIWEEVLGVPVSLDDNFFDLGGNSLYAMRIATAMRNQGLPPLPVRELYARQTVRRLGEQLNAPLT